MEYMSKDYKQLKRMVEEEYKCSSTEACTKHIAKILNNLELYNKWLVKLNSPSN